MTTPVRHPTFRQLRRQFLSQIQTPGEELFQTMAQIKNAMIEAEVDLAIKRDDFESFKALGIKNVVAPHQVTKIFSDKRYSIMEKILEGGYILSAGDTVAMISDLDEHTIDLIKESPYRGKNLYLLASIAIVKQDLPTLIYILDSGASLTEDGLSLLETALQDNVNINIINELVSRSGVNLRDMPLNIISENNAVFEKFLREGVYSSYEIENFVRSHLLKEDTIDVIFSSGILSVDQIDRLIPFARREADIILLRKINEFKTVRQ